MMELELKHLAPYLPYGLEIINNVNKKRELTIYYLNYWKELKRLNMMEINSRLVQITITLKTN